MVYCRIFTLFGQYWDKKHPENVMFFNSVKDEVGDHFTLLNAMIFKFVELLKRYLKRSKADLFVADLSSICE